MIRSRKMLKRMDHRIRIHPCLTPTVVLNHSPLLPSIWTALVALSQICSVVRTRFALILHFRMVANKAACQTLSNKDMVQILLVHVGGTLLQDSKVEDLFSGDPSDSEPSLFFGLAFLTVQDDFQHDFAQMTDEADCSVDLAELKVALFRECYNQRLSRPFSCSSDPVADLC